jgi:hypothetical protein
MVKKVVEKTKPKSKAKTNKKPRKLKSTIDRQITESIIDIVIDQCCYDDGLLILEQSEGTILMLKKHTVTVQGIKNPNGMQPYQEPPKERTFFHVFVLQWSGKALTGNLVNMGVPVTWVKTPHEAVRAIELA